jgi:hypothetical protein
MIGVFRNGLLDSLSLESLVPLAFGNYDVVKGYAKD